MGQRVIIWDEISSINGISAEEIFESRPDLALASGDIFLVVDNHNRTSEIQIGSIIASNFKMEEGLSLQEIADRYLQLKIQEQEEQEIERLTNVQLQEEVALLSYEVMMLQSRVNEQDTLLISKTKSVSKGKIIKIWYNRGYWTKEMVETALELNNITKEEYEDIIK